MTAIISRIFENATAAMVVASAGDQGRISFSPASMKSYCLYRARSGVGADGRRVFQSISCGCFMLRLNRVYRLCGSERTLAPPRRI